MDQLKKIISRKGYEALSFYVATVHQLRCAERSELESWGLPKGDIEKIVSVQSILDEDRKARTEVNEPDIAGNLAVSLIGSKTREHLLVIFLSIKHDMIGHQILSIGNGEETVACPKDVFGTALRHRAARIIVAHNHPSGHIDPSSADITLTEALIRAGNVLNMAVLDHLVVNDFRYHSIRNSHGYLWK